MCGIAGLVSFEEEARRLEARFDAMQRSIAPRGPDQQGRYVDERAALLHTRLAVVDVEHGTQPMREREYTLIYNGELYNAPELRQELEAAGARLHTRSDTELVLRGYMQWGEEVLSRLNGIYAFAVWNSETRELFLARDRMGVKPLFFAERGARLIFGSELKALLASGLVAPEVDEQGVAELMLLGPGRTPGCGVFRGVSELLPGECARYSVRGLARHSYFRLTDREIDDSPAVAIERTRQLVLDAITRQLVSDVPIGTFLSGGLDSSIISAVAARELAKKGEQLKTFSVDYTDNARYFHTTHFQPSDDRAYIKKMVDFLGSGHHTVTLGVEELTDALFDAVRARDLPGMADVDSSLLLFCRSVKQEVTVALSGECADEIFGGYPWYRDADIRAAYGFPWSQSTAMRAGFLHPDYAGIAADAYVAQRYDATVRAADKRPGLSPVESRMKEMMNLNVSWFMQTLLDRKDRMSMATGLEVRVPFCDHRIAEYLYALPWSVKDMDGREKGLLRAAVRDLLPEEVRLRKKSPYPKTWHPAYLARLRDMLRERMADTGAPIWRMVKAEACAQLLTGESERPWYGQLMTTPQTIAYLLQLDFWMREYHVALV